MQIEVRKRQNQALLAQQNYASVIASQPPALTQALLMQQSLALASQKPLLQTPMQQTSQSVHPLAYSRELHLTRGLSMGPSALDKAVKAAEVSNYSIVI